MVLVEIFAVKVVEPALAVAVRLIANAANITVARRNGKKREKNNTNNSRNQYHTQIITNKIMRENLPRRESPNDERVPSAPHKKERVKSKEQTKTSRPCITPLTQPDEGDARSVKYLARKPRRRRRHTTRPFASILVVVIVIICFFFIITYIIITNVIIVTVIVIIIIIIIFFHVMDRYSIDGNKLF